MLRTLTRKPPTIRRCTQHAAQQEGQENEEATIEDADVPTIEELDRDEKVIAGRDILYWGRISQSVPPDANIISTKWLFKKKILADERIRYKARLVKRGFQQIQGRDYDTTYAATASLVVFRMLLALAALNGWSLRQPGLCANLISLRHSSMGQWTRMYMLVFRKVSMMSWRDLRWDHRL